MEHADAAGQVAALKFADHLEMHRVGALGVAEDVEHAVVQPERGAGLHVTAQLFAHADRRIGMTDDGERDLVERHRRGQGSPFVRVTRGLRAIQHPAHVQAFAAIASRSASNQRWPWYASGSRCVPSAHSFQALTNSSRSSPIRNRLTSSIFSST